MIKNKDVPVYLFTGFLESGKTKFIQETLEDKRFGKGERTLLLVCEEGEEEYAPDQFAGKDTFIRVLESEEELNKENLSRFLAETRAQRVLVEYNGMWMLDRLYNEMPEGWVVYQEFFFADAGTFISYNANMRQLVYDKLKSCELAVFNRFNGTMDKMEFHKIVRGASRRADIAYEYVGGKVEYDDIEDPLPFDLEADIVEIGDDDYAVWYRDMSEEPDKYENKTVRFKCNAVVHSKIPAGCFLIGRHMMTCCADDIQFAGLVCQWEKAAEVKNKSWMILTARINFRRHKAYAGKGPVLSFVDMEYCEAPEQPVAAF
ncbi:MAG: GTPase [Oscillospiraceae bacterium]|nr:GTPase [Oscillospiraceae bacterium]